MTDKTQKNWEQHWQTQDIPWDAGSAAPSLERLLSGQLADAFGPLPSKSGRTHRALVPGCGSGWDVFALATAGYQAFGLDLAPSARSKFEAEREKAKLPPERAQLITGDFFTFESEAPFDFIWDYTFYCAIEPALRSAWKAKMLSLLAPGGYLSTLIFPVLPEADPAAGPPFPLNPGQLKVDLSPQLEAIYLEPAEVSHPTRVGKEWLGVWRRPAPPK